MTDSTQTKSVPSLEKISKNIQHIFRQKSLETLKLTLDRQDIEIQEIPNHDDFLYGQMMGYILIHNESMKASFKIHYSQSLARHITAQQLGLKLEDVDSESTNDFMREYCNLAAGYISDTFAHNNIISNISIPLITDGFDEVWFSDNTGPLDQKDYWQLNWENHSLVLTSVIEIRNFDVFKNLSLPKETPKSNDKGITFL